MFGLIKGCRLNRSEKQTWMAHLCGLCLAMGENHGQRLTVNTDGVLLSLLCEAQSPAEFECLRGRCPFRRFREVKIVEPHNSASRYAASVSALISASEILDHIADGDSAARYFPGFFSRLTSHWRHSARRSAKRLGFDASHIEALMQRQLRLEQHRNKDFLFYSQAVEEAAGETCGHTAVISGCPDNKEPLCALGSTG